MDIDEQPHAQQEHINNLDELSPEVKHYFQMYEERLTLKREVTRLTRQINVLTPRILDEMQVLQSDTVPLIVNGAQKTQFGESGALKLVHKDTVAPMTKSTLRNMCIQLFAMLMPNADKQDVLRIGVGSFNWMWSHRNRRVTRHLKRVYLQKKEKPATKRPRQTLAASSADVMAEVDTSASASSSSPTPEKQNWWENEPLNELQDLPTTCEEFQNIPSLRRALGAVEQNFTNDSACM